MTKNHRQILESFLASPARPEATLGFHELEGFLFAVACAPQLIMPSEWMPVIFNNEEANYADMPEAESVTAALMELYNAIIFQIQDGDLAMPQSIKLEKAVLDNVGEQAALGQWSLGFLLGHDWLIELWNNVSDEEIDEELGGSVMILTSFADQQLAESYLREVERPEEETLASFLETFLPYFDDAMASYANLGRSIYEASMQESASSPGTHSPKPGRNDPCPCGSGRKYKHCCLQ